MQEMELLIQEWIAKYDYWVYALLIALMFIETGTPFTFMLPGDTILFSCGALCVSGVLSPEMFLFTNIPVALLGDLVNYYSAYYFGDKILKRFPRFYNKQNLDRARGWIEGRNFMWFVAGRIMPYVRSFTPFMAGLTHTDIRRFMPWNMLGAVIWLCSVFFLGYFFGNIPWVKENYSLIFLWLLLVGLFPIFGWLFKWLKKRWIG